MTEIKQQLEDQALSHRLVTLARDLILIPTVTDSIQDIDRGMQFIRNHIDLEGLDIDEFRSNDLPSLVLRPKGITKPKVMLNGHLDVVALPEANYNSRIEDGKIIGPGAGDMKGAIAVLMEVFYALHMKYPGISLGLTITSDEEKGGQDGIKYLVENHKIDCDLAIIPDSGSINEITVEEKGVLHIKVTTEGVAGHGARPWLSKNAIEKLFHFFHTVRQTFESLKNGDDHWFPTCAMTVIGTDNSVPNRIPDMAEGIFDIRFPASFTVEQILELLTKSADDDIQLQPLLSSDATSFKPDPVFISITEQVTGQSVNLLQAHGGSDARFFYEAGIPVILSRPNVGATHTKDEWVEIQSLVQLYVIYEHYLVQTLA